jgi:uncharacterized membrane protein YfcA
MLEIVIYVLIGIGTGLLSGLFGIGGGIIMVPALILILQHHPDFQSANIMLIAANTSLIIMAITSASTANAYRQRNALVWSIFWKIIPSLIVGLSTGAALSHLLSDQLLINLFAVFLIGIAIHLWFAARRPSQNLRVKKSKPTHSLSHQQWILLIVGGFGVGNLSTLFGIGGGILFVPLFLSLHCTMHEASGTSALCGIVSAIVGSLLLTQVPQSSDSLPNLLGNIFWPAAILIGATSVVCAPLGARIAFHLKTSLLKQLFAGILFISAWSLLQI